MDDVMKGRILNAISNGARFFTEIQRKADVSPSTLSKYLRELEHDGLLVVELDRNKRKPFYRLNEERKDEIDRLINVYVSSEIKEAKEKLSFVSKLPTLTDEDRKKIEELIKKLESL
ncbi:MAG: hypothetical protein DRN30_05475 [Thermoplasmata archaeon]|nr:MAG: hypothetical protein DRN30_05475 [Thermoplasmata archaeon]